MDTTILVAILFAVICVFIAFKAFSSALHNAGHASNERYVERNHWNKVR